MGGLARAFAFEELEEDPSLVEGQTKECSACDPDSPKPVPREKCSICGGTGREKLAAMEILSDLRASMAQGLGDEEQDIPEGDEYEDDDGLYLEY